MTSKLKLVTIEDDYTEKLYPSSNLSSDAGNADNPGLAKTGKFCLGVFPKIQTIFLWSENQLVIWEP